MIGSQGREQGFAELNERQEARQGRARQQVLCPQS